MFFYQESLEFCNPSRATIGCAMTSKLKCWTKISCVARISCSRICRGWFVVIGKKTHHLIHTLCISVIIFISSGYNEIVTAIIYYFVEVVQILRRRRQSSRWPNTSSQTLWASRSKHWGSPSTSSSTSPKIQRYKVNVHDTVNVHFTNCR